MTNVLNDAFQTDELLECFDGGEEEFLKKIVSEIGERQGVNMIQLFRIADCDLVTEHLGGPADDGAFMWQDGAILHNKFKELTLAEKIAATKYVADNYCAREAATALASLFGWMGVPESSQSHHLLQAIQDCHTHIEQKAALAAFELLAENEKLL